MKNLRVKSSIIIIGVLIIIYGFGFRKFNVRVEQMVSINYAKGRQVYLIKIKKVIEKMQQKNKNTLDFLPKWL